MSELDDLIARGASELFPELFPEDFSDVSGNSSSTASTSVAAPPNLDALIASGAQKLFGGTQERPPEFSDVSGGAASSADRLPEQSAPPAPGSLDRDFMHWYANYVKNTRAELSYDQARQLYKSLTPEQRAHVPAAPSPYSDLTDNDLDRNVASGMKQGSDFLAHLPETVARSVAAIPYSVNSALEAQDRQRRVDMAAAATETTGEDYVTPEQRRQAATPISAPPQDNVMLPDIVEETFQSSREERERLQGRAATRGAEAGQSPEAAALAYAVPQTLGNLIDPTMLLGVGEGTRAARGGASWLDRLIARGAEEEFGVHAADAAEPALTKAVAPSEELVQYFPDAKIDAREYVQPAPATERRLPTEGRPLPAPPEGIQPGEPWLQREIPATRSPHVQDEASAAIRPEERVDAGLEAPVSGPVEERVATPESGRLEGQGEVVASGNESLRQPTGYRSPEDPLAPGAEGAGGPLPRESLAPGSGPEALPADDRQLAEGTGEPLTSLKKSYSEPERAERGLSPVEREFFGTTDETMARGRDAVEGDPSWPRSKLIEDLLKEDRPPRPHEVAALLYDKAKILKEEKAAMDALEAARAAGDDAAEGQARLALGHAREALDANTEASQRSLSQWGEAGRLAQLVIREDYSVSRVLQRARAAELGGQLAPELEKKLTELSTRVEATSKALDEAKDQLAAMRLKKAMAAMERESAHETREAARRQVRQTLDEELADLSAQLEKRAAGKQGKLFSTANPFQGLDPDSIALIGKIAKNRVKAGINTAEGLVDSVYNIVRNHFAGITPRDVRDAISGYGQAPKGSRQATQSQLAKINREMRLLSKIEDAEAGQLPARTGAPRAPRDPKIKALEKRLRNEMRQQGLDRNMRLDAYRGRLEGRKADLERQLATGNFTPVGRPLAVEDVSTRKLKVEIEELRRRIDYEVRKVENKNRTRPQKFIHNLVRARRATLLSSSSALSKLFTAASYRTLLTTPTKQAIGALYAQAPLIRRIAAMAPREGTVSLRAEAEAIKEFFNPETWKDAYKTAAPRWAGGRGTGMSELDTLYSKKEMPPEVLDFFGHIHNGEKTLAKRPEFARSVELRNQHARKNGIDIGDPEFQAKRDATAYDDALRAVMLEDNIWTEFHKAGKARLRGLRIAEARERGEELGQAIKDPEGNPVIDFMLPITKVATNYAGQEIEGAIGIPRAVYRFVIRKGVDNLSEKDAEYIMRNLKAGTLGPALFALGYYNYDKIGGYHQRNEHRAEGEPEPMTIQAHMFGHEVVLPHNVLHDPSLELVQAGASFHRVKEAREEAGKKWAAGAGALATVRGSAEQVPFYGELLRTQNALETPEGLAEFGGNLTRSLFIPPDIQRMARILDQEEGPGPFDFGLEQLGLKHIDPIRRYPQNFFFDQLKVGIPWAREQVSDEKNP